jgi:putative Mg2+ transporter-C (MgtC) family protein
MDGFLETLSRELFSPPGPGASIIIIRLVGAAFLAALIGLEREFRDQAAGLRTNMLVGIAAAAFALTGEGLIGQYQGEPGLIRIDPLRLVQAVTGGVAFLAAGLIVFMRGEVHGLTTGAAMWLSAAAGLAVGLGQWLVAVVAAIGGLLVLAVLRALEKLLGFRRSAAGDDDGAARLPRED